MKRSSCFLQYWTGILLFFRLADGLLGCLLVVIRSCFVIILQEKLTFDVCNPLWIQPCRYDPGETFQKVLEEKHRRRATFCSLPRTSDSVKLSPLSSRHAEVSGSSLKQLFLLFQGQDAFWSRRGTLTRRGSFRHTGRLEPRCSRRVLASSWTNIADQCTHTAW